MSTDDLKWLLDRNSEYIRDADSKVSIVLAALAVIATLLFSSDNFINYILKIIKQNDYINLFILMIMIVSAITCATMSCFVIFPRIIPHVKSLIFFGDIADIWESRDYFASLKEDSFSFEEELVNQIIETAIIAKKKMDYQKKAIIFFICMLITLLLLIARSVR